MMGTAAGLASQGYVGVRVARSRCSRRARRGSRCGRACACPNLEREDRGDPRGADGRRGRQVAPDAGGRDADACPAAHEGASSPGDAVEAAECVTRGGSARRGRCTCACRGRTRRSCSTRAIGSRSARGRVLRDGGDLAIATNGVTDGGSAGGGGALLAAQGIEARVLDARESVVPHGRGAWCSRRRATAARS
jgi:transketolase C-terminal domain/subunit